MPLETGTYISDLVASNPSGADDVQEADDHLRLIKSLILATFPNITGAVTASHDELNNLAGTTYPFTTPSIASGAITTTTLDAAAVTADKLAANSVTLAKLATQAGQTILANPTATAAVPSAVTLGGALGFSGTSLMSIPRGHIAKLTLSTAGSSSTFSVAAGEALDSTHAEMITLASALSKTTGAWTVGTGNGALDTGSIAAATWYHVWLIKRSDTGVVDVLISTSASSPTMPANYDYKRRIGSMLTDGSSQWTLFNQPSGDVFLWDVTVVDAAEVPPSSTNQLYTLTTPSGIVTEALFTLACIGTSAAFILILDPNQTATTPSVNAFHMLLLTDWKHLWVRLPTDTSSQVRRMCDTLTGFSQCRIYTHGWIDRRGQDD